MLHRPTILLAALGCAVVVAPLPAAEKPTVSVAHIKLAGDLDESPVAADPLLGISPENFKAKLDRIKKAQKDDKIQGLYLYLDGPQLGWGKLDELTKAIRDFRNSGKKAFAYLEAGNSRDYLIGLACDEVYLPEPGWLMLTGIRTEVTFFKDLFDKIGVKADMLATTGFLQRRSSFQIRSLASAEPPGLSTRRTIALTVLSPSAWRIASTIVVEPTMSPPSRLCPPLPVVIGPTA